MPSEPPTEAVIALVRKGASNKQIIEELESQGYSYEQIADALTQAETKSNIEAPPAPSPPGMRPSALSMAKPEAFQQQSPVQVIVPRPNMQAMEGNSFGRDTEDMIEQIAESIIEEKWRKMLENVGDLNVWKEKVRTDILSMKQEIVRLNEKIESLQKIIIGKVRDYDANITEVGTEIKALEKVLQNVITPLTTNVKELSKITERLKK